MKKAITSALAIALTLSLSACGTNTDEPNPPSTNKGQTQGSEAPKETLPSSNNSQDETVDTSEQIDDPNESKLAYLVHPDTKYDYDYSTIRGFSEGYFTFQDRTTELYGYLDTEGKVVIEPKYYSAFPFSEGLAAVMDSSGKYDFIDPKGNVVIDGDFSGVYQRYLLKGTYRSDGIYENTFTYRGFLNGEALVTKGGECHIIDTNGKIIRTVEMKDVDGKEFALYGNVLVRENTGFFNDDPYHATYEHSCFLVDKYFNTLISDKIYDKLYAYPSRLSDNLILLKKSDEFGFFNANGEMLYKFPDSHNERKTNYTDKYYTLEKTINNIVKQAVYAMNGECVIDYNYKEIIPIPDNTFIATTNSDLVGLIDVDGNEIIPFSEQNTSYNINYYLELLQIGNHLYNYKTGEIFTNDAFLDKAFSDLFHKGHFYLYNDLYYVFTSHSTLKVLQINDNGYKASEEINMLPNYPGNLEDYIKYGIFPQEITDENGKAVNVVFSQLVIE